jgi:murein DD-endopeptidase MepM/ murein hydrolase activator NlpD
VSRVALACAILAAVFAAWQVAARTRAVEAPAPAPPVAAAPAPVVPLPTLAPVPEKPPVVAGELARRETVSEALQERGITRAMVHEIATSLRPVFDFRYAHPGDRFRLTRDVAGAIEEFVFERSANERYLLKRGESGLVAERVTPEIDVRRVRMAGVITGNLYESIRQLGESGELAYDFAEIFAWDVDFSKVQPGDEFSVVYERRHLKSGPGAGTYIGPGRILAARYANADDDYTAIYFQLDEKRGGYYRADGSSVERTFLQAPLNYRRISSYYSTNRLHPILKVRRAHPAIDYAAASGTPVWSVAHGTVIYRGWSGGLGNTVKIRHHSGYVSVYGHLSRFPKDLRIGQHVAQKQVIGYVGSTGLATGPHLHFILEQNGRSLNPATVKMALGEPVPASRMPSFLAQRDAYLAQLEPTPLRVTTQEAL